MALDDDAVITAAVGYVYTNTIGAAAPSPAEIDNFDPDTFGAQVHTLKVTGSPTGGTLTVTAGGDTTSALPYNASAAAVQAALEALAAVGTGNVLVSGTSISDTNGFTIAYVGEKLGSAIATSATGSLTGGTTPAANVTVTTAPNGWALTKRVMEDAQLSWVPRRYLKGEDPHPFAHKYGGILNETTFPLRNGCLVWDIEDKSGWGTETAFGGSILVGLVRAIVNIASDGTTEGVEVYHGDPTYPGEYYVPWFLGTNPKAPHVVYQEGPLTGIKSSEFKYYEATDTSFLTGGQSMPGVNEAISAVIQMGGDLLAAHISAAIEVQLPPIGGAIDAIANPIYSDTILAFMEIPTLRAMELSLPLPGLENAITGLGDFHYYEGWADGADKAFTLSAIMAIRAKIWATRAHTSHTLKISDAAPYYIGAPGYGHFWLGDRIGTTVLGFPDPYTIFVERVSKISYSWGADGPKGWEIEVGYREPQDPMLKAFEMIRDINSSLGDLGVL